MSHDFPRLIVEKHCYIQCPADECNCHVGNPVEWERQQGQQQRWWDDIYKKLEEMKKGYEK